MEWMIPAVVATLASSLVLFFVHAYLYTCERQEFLRTWALGWGLYSTRFLFLLIFILWHSATAFLILNQLASLWAGWLILKGATRFSGRGLPRWWLLI